MKGTRTWYDGTPPLRDRAIVTWHLHPTLGKDVWLNPYLLIYLIKQLRVCSLDILFTIIDFGLIRYHCMLNCIRTGYWNLFRADSFPMRIRHASDILFFFFFFFGRDLIPSHLKLGLQFLAQIDWAWNQKFDGVYRVMGAWKENIIINNEGNNSSTTPTTHAVKTMNNKQMDCKWVD